MSKVMKGFALLTLFFGVMTQVFAEDKKPTCTKDKTACDVTFTTVQPVPALSIVNCTSPVGPIGPYTITNNLPFQVNIGAPFLVQNDSLNSNAVTIASTTCTSSLPAFGSCEIFLNFQPCAAGTLNWELEVPVFTQQGVVKTPLKGISNNAPLGPGPAGIVSQDGFFYIVNENTNNVTQCVETVDPSQPDDGNLGSCVDAGATNLQQPNGITFAQQFAYISNLGGTSVTMCNVTNNPNPGNLGSCQDSGAGPIFNASSEIEFFEVNLVSYAYVANLGNNSISICPVDNTGAFQTPCRVFTDPLISSPSDMVFVSPRLSTSENIYITNQSTNKVTQCTVTNSPNDGDLGACVDSGVGNTFSAPAGITTQVYRAFPLVTFAYITNKSTNTVTVCKINNSNGLFFGCVDSGVGAVFDGPDRLWFQGERLGMLYAYVTNNLGNTVSQCTPDINSGLFTICMDSGASPVR